jgi:C-terminal processing protease CtpA/Prc
MQFLYRIGCDKIEKFPETQIDVNKFSLTITVNAIKTPNDDWIEEKGVEPNYFHERTKNDCFNNDVDLYQVCFDNGL